MIFVFMVSNWNWNKISRVFMPDGGIGIGIESKPKITGRKKKY